MLSLVAHDRRLAVVYAALEAAGWDRERALEILDRLANVKGWVGLHAWLLVAFKDDFHRTADAVEAGARPSAEALEEARKWVRKLAAAKAGNVARS